MEQVLLFATILAPIVVALNELIKKTVKMPKNLIPWLGLVFSFLIGAAAYPFTDMDLVLRLWAGGLAGLSSIGLFELGKYRAGNTKEEK